MRAKNEVDRRAVAAGRVLLTGLALASAAGAGSPRALFRPAFDAGHFGRN